MVDKKYILIKDDDQKTLINKNGTVLATGSIVKISNDNKYIFVDNKVYDFNLKEIYTFDSNVDNEYDITFADGIIAYTPSKKKNLLIDLETGNILWEDIQNVYPYYYNENILYYRFTVNNKGYIFDVKTKAILYEDIKYNTYEYYDDLKFTYKDNTIYIIEDKIYADNTKINDEYILKKDTCADGYKLADTKGNIVIDKCFHGYKILFDNAIIGLKIDDKSILFYQDKEIEGAVFTLQGDYIKVDEVFDLLGDGSKSAYYDKNLAKIDFTEDESLYYIGNGYYYSYNFMDNNYYFYDKDLNRIGSSFDSIFCYENNYCDASINGYTHYLYKDGKKVIDEKLTDIQINDEEIKIQTLYKTYILKLGTSSKKLDLSIDYNIDLDKIIEEYNLQDMEFTINKNEELFTKYAYIIEHSPTLLDYKKQVYNLFKVIIDKSKYLDEFYFLSKLGKLNIIYEEATLNGNALSTYQDYSTRVSLSSSQDDIVYHELMHFVDFSINYSAGTSVYNCDGKYQIKSYTQYEDDTCSYVGIVYTNYLTEAGAEINTTKYATKLLNSLAYDFATNYLEGLEYIYGSEEVDKWYFGDINYFYLDLLNDYEDVATVNKIISALNRTTSLEPGSIYESGYLLDVLIDLYQKHIGSNYLQDKKFAFILKTMQDIDYIETSKYYNEVKTIFDMDYGSLNDLKEDEGYEVYSPRIDPIIIDDKMYLSWYAWNNSNASYGVLWIDYDFDNDVVKDYSVIKLY